MTTPNIDLEPLWKAEDVARYLGISLRAVQRLRTHHQLPALKIGGTYRFRGSSVAAWAAQRESDCTPPVQTQARAPRPRTVTRVVGRRPHVELL